MSKILPRSFYERDVVDVARDLLGRHICRGAVTLRITEVEAYDQFDSACHAFSGLTARNAPLWGPPGRAYVYLCYGLHNMFNVVADHEGRAAAVLIRSCEAVSGLEAITARRGGKSGPGALAGPGKVGQSLALDTSWSDHVLHRRGGVSLREGQPPARILVGPRVGIEYATLEDRERPWRFAIEHTRAVSYGGSLRAQRGPLRGARRR